MRLKKTAALGRSVSLGQVHPSIAALYHSHFEKTPRSFVEMMVFTLDNNRTFPDIISAAQRLQQRGLKRLSAEQIQAEMLSCGQTGPDTAVVNAVQPADPQQIAIESSESSAPALTARKEQLKVAGHTSMQMRPTP